MSAAVSTLFSTSLKFNKDIKMLPFLSSLHLKYRIQDNGGLRWFSALTPFLAELWKWLRPENLSGGQISCPFQGSGRFRIMRFIGVLRNAAKTGDEYPHGDREGSVRREDGGPPCGNRIDRRKGEIRFSSHFWTNPYRAISSRNAFLASFLRTVTILFLEFSLFGFISYIWRNFNVKNVTKN